jgi:antitoxin ParD1/3/4
MNISLTKELESFVHSKVRQGFYHSASEVIREGLRLLAEQEDIKKKRLEMLNLEIDKGLSSLKSGDVISSDEMMEHVQNRRQKYKDSNA